jgi:hypothetical protein
MNRSRARRRRRREQTDALPPHREGPRPGPSPLTVVRRGVLFTPERHPALKDPSPVFDGDRWHLFATGCGLPHGLEIAHATAPTLDGPWTEHPPPQLQGVEVEHPAAPGVVAEGHRLHLFLQHHFNRLGGAIEHLVSDDGGACFQHVDTALTSTTEGQELGVYDPDPAIIDGHPFLAYAAMSVVGQPDLYLARSRTGSWDGPWERQGCILDHHSVEHHNRVGDHDYEWGLEGPHLLQLPDGSTLLTAVCFLRGHPPGHRQRLLLAVSHDVRGPYSVIGPVVDPEGPGASGENGHGAAVLEGDAVRLVYQELSGRRSWHLRHAAVPVGSLTGPRGWPDPAERRDDVA